MPAAPPFPTSHSSRCHRKHCFESPNGESPPRPRSAGPRAGRRPNACPPLGRPAAARGRIRLAVTRAAPCPPLPVPPFAAAGRIRRLGRLPRPLLGGSGRLASCWLPPGGTCPPLKSAAGRRGALYLIFLCLGPPAAGRPLIRPGWARRHPTPRNSGPAAPAPEPRRRGRACARGSTSPPLCVRIPPYVNCPRPVALSRLPAAFGRVGPRTRHVPPAQRPSGAQTRPHRGDRTRSSPHPPPPPRAFAT